ncbi:MAG: 3',5'-cyclic adenosine monophosphate phosphodiesterase CpdA [Chlamydiae bacterium]|nr:3',5'-cyclic adenosine monophosphate phosphodiesterase CpdA [Chlamydiota bacterium]
MKFIHVADIHLDSRATALKSFYGQDSVCISQLQQNAFASLIDLALREKVDFILIAGDLFDSNWKDYSVGLFFIQQIKRLKCPVYFIRGNHDSESRLVKSLPYPENVKVFESSSSHSIVDEKLKVVVHGQSYAHYHIQDDLAAAYPNPVSGYLNIGLLHTSGDRRNGESPYAPFEKEALVAKKYNYWALGHLHQNQILSKDPYIVYSGALQGRHVKEAGRKGCYLITTKNQEIAEVSFCHLSTVQWGKVSVDLTGITREEQLKVLILEEVNRHIKDQEPAELVLRIVFEGQNDLLAAFENDHERWINVIFCWLDQNINIKVHIEKLVDCSSTEAERKDRVLENPILTSLLGKLDDSNIKKELHEIFSQEYNSLKQKIPDEVFDVALMNQNDDDLVQANLTNHIKSYLESKFF